MRRFMHAWTVALLLLVAGTISWLALQPGRGTAPPEPGPPSPRPHLDHTSLLQGPFVTGPDVTRACLGCHPEAGRQMLSSRHWLWLDEPTVLHDRQSEPPRRIGKRNLLNNFCISIAGNEASCTICHAGYGWRDGGFDFNEAEQVDCLVCHERSGGYVKGQAGLPVEGTDLLAAARSVGYPNRRNCGACHNYGGGGLGVKHGDLDPALDNPAEALDVHMGRHDMLCIDCHATRDHRIAGRSIAVSVDHRGGIGCAGCHGEAPHADARINSHTGSLACQTCHIPRFARKFPTKTEWEWAKAGDPTRPEEVHTYLKKKGEFVYRHDVVPEYHWFNLTAARYLLGDPVDPAGVADINRPLGSINDRAARIWPFKVHRGNQPYDTGNRYLVPPVTAGEGGYWNEFDWDRAIRLGTAAAGLAYSGSFGFIRTRMFWPLSHMVAPARDALGCIDCHAENGRFDWRALGYEGDPARSGGRP